MTNPIWIDKEDCLAFHAEMLARFGGLDGTRDQGLLESALNRPKQLHSYGQPSLYEMAASYATGIVKNHPFIDGNKRSGFMSAALFLEINGKNFTSTEEEVVERTLALAASAITEADCATWLEKSCA